MATAKKKLIASVPAAKAPPPRARRHASEPMVEDREPLIVAPEENAYAALGLPNAEERNLKMRLALLIEEEMMRRGLTQKAAAEIMGFQQPDVSAILKGRTRGYSVFRLLQAVSALGFDMAIVPTRREDGRSGAVELTRYGG